MDNVLTFPSNLFKFIFIIFIKEIFIYFLLFSLVFFKKLLYATKIYLIIILVNFIVILMTFDNRIENLESVLFIGFS